MGIPYGSLAKGYVSGLTTGHERALRKEETEVKKNIERLKQFNQERLLYMKNQQLAAEKEQQMYINNTAESTRYFEKAEKLTPDQRQQYFTYLPKMPFYQQASPSKQEFYNALETGSMFDMKNYTSITKSFAKNYKDNDNAGMMQDFATFAATFGESKNKGVQAEIKHMGTFFNIKPDKKFELETSLEKRTQFPEGSYERGAYEDRIKKLTAPAKSDVTIYTGDIGKTTKAKFEEKYFNLTSQLDEWKEIKKNFRKNKNLLSVQTAANALYTKLKNRFEIKVSPEDQKQLDKYTELGNQVAKANLFLRHALLGTAMTKTEEKTYFPAFPAINMDTLGRFTNTDSEIEFNTKLNETIANTERMINRLRYALEYGSVLKNKKGEAIGFFDEKGKPLSPMDKRFAPKTDEQAVPQTEIEQGVPPNVSVPDQAVTPEILAQAAREFGRQFPNYNNEQIVDLVKKKYGL